MKRNKEFGLFTKPSRFKVKKLVRTFSLVSECLQKGFAMHELPVINSILKVVLRHAVDNKVKKVVAVHLQVGELSDLEDKWMQQYFDYLAKGGIADGARLVIERTPVVMKCSDCEFSYVVDLKQEKAMVCPECGSEKSSLLSGREYFVKNLEAI